MNGNLAENHSKEDKKMKSLLRAGLALLVVSAPALVSAAQTVAACCCGPSCPGCC